MERIPPEYLNAWDRPYAATVILRVITDQRYAETKRLLEKAIVIEPKNTAVLDDLASSLSSTPQPRRAARRIG